VLLGATHQQDVRYFATFLITSGTYASIGLMIAWCMPQFSHAKLFSWFYHSIVGHNLGSETKKAAGISLYSTIGLFGGILGSHLYPLTEGPAYTFVLATFLAPYLIHCILAMDLLVWIYHTRSILLYWRTDHSFCVPTLFVCAVCTFIECEPGSDPNLTPLIHSRVLQRFHFIWTTCGEISSMANQIQMTW
jgi:hypothetical protein